ncbi:MAG: hypothetical protein AABW80_01205 [Nanoarchaeota archaeon]
MIDEAHRRLVAEINSESAQNYFLELARRNAKARGLTVSFEGLYFQGRKAEPELKSQTPFVIAQDAESLRKLKEGILEGLIFEIGCIGEIRNGVIRPEHINFCKVYSEKMYSFIINRSPIHYFGKSTDAGTKYEGEWRVPVDTFKDMSESGTFQLIRIYHE